MLFTFLLYFAVPFAISLLVTEHVLGFGHLWFSGAHRAYGAAALACLAFLVCTLSVSRFLADKPSAHAMRSFRVDPVQRIDVQIAGLCFVVGLAATLVLAARFSGGMRSQLVAGYDGQLLFGISYMMIVGYMVIGLRLLNTRSLVLFAALTVLFAGVLLVLGGRGRVIWPMISLFATWQITKGTSLNLKRMALYALLILVLFAMMDPLTALFHGQGVEALTRFSDPGGILKLLFVEKRNFDSFYNFFMIHYHDPFPHSLHYLTAGPRADFMNMFFPEVLAAGVGFPPTVPGTFWMVGGLPALLLGAMAYGVVTGMMSRLYFATSSQLRLCFMIYLFTWVFNIGASLFDNLAKIFAILLAMAPFFVLRWVALRVNAVRLA